MNVFTNNKLLAKLFSSVDTTRQLVLVCDQLGCDTKTLIRTLICNRLKQMNVIMVCIENQFLDSVQKPLNYGIENDFKVIDLFTDYGTDETNVCHRLRQRLSEVSEESIVFIDSLTPLLLMVSLSETSCLLNDLCHRFKQLVCVLHVDCHSQHMCESIQQLSHCLIRLSTTKSDKCVDTFKAIVRHRRPHRKTHFSVKQSLEVFSIVDNSIVYVKDSKDTTGQTCSDPMANLSFNLSLKDSELKAKNSLLLPYIKTIDGNEPKVYYEYDKNDDIDEEDPDEDLEI